MTYEDIYNKTTGELKKLVIQSEKYASQLLQKAFDRYDKSDKKLTPNALQNWSNISNKRAKQYSVVQEVKNAKAENEDIELNYRNQYDKMFRPDLSPQQKRSMINSMKRNQLVTRLMRNNNILTDKTLYDTGYINSKGEHIDGWRQIRKNLEKRLGAEKGQITDDKNKLLWATYRRWLEENARALFDKNFDSTVIQQEIFQTMEKNPDIDDSELLYKAFKDLSENDEDDDFEIDDFDDIFE